VLYNSFAYSLCLRKHQVERRCLVGPFINDGECSLPVSTR